MRTNFFFVHGVFTYEFWECEFIMTSTVVNVKNFQGTKNFKNITAYVKLSPMTMQKRRKCFRLASSTSHSEFEMCVKVHLCLIGWCHILRNMHCKWYFYPCLVPYRHTVWVDWRSMKTCIYRDAIFYDEKIFTDVFIHVECCTQSSPSLLYSLYSCCWCHIAFCHPFASLMRMKNARNERTTD